MSTRSGFRLPEDVEKGTRRNAVDAPAAFPGPAFPNEGAAAEIGGRDREACLARFAREGAIEDAYATGEVVQGEVLEKSRAGLGVRLDAITRPDGPTRWAAGRV